MVDVAQSVRASDCGSESRGFEPHLPPEKAFFGRPFLFPPLCLTLPASGIPSPPPVKNPNRIEPESLRRADTESRRTADALGKHTPPSIKI